MNVNSMQFVPLKFRQRFDGRIFGWVFLVMMIATVIFVSRQPRLYEARGALEIPEIQVRDFGDVRDATVSSPVEMNTVHEVMASQTMMRRVIARLTPAERAAFFGPYESADHSDKEITRLMLANRTLRVVPASRKWEMRYRHPDRQMASRIVDLFLREGVAYEARVRTDEQAYAVQSLGERAEQAGKRVEICAREIVAYRESRPGLSVMELEQDASYQALIKKADNERKLHEIILARISDMHASRDNEAWRISLSPTPPDENAYLLGPLAVSAAWGTSIAVVAGLLAAGLFKRRSIPANYAEV